MNVEAIQLMLNSQVFEVNDKYLISRPSNFSSDLKWKKNDSCPCVEATMKCKISVDGMNHRGMIAIQRHIDIEEDSPNHYSAMLYMLDDNRDIMSSTTIISVGT